MARERERNKSGSEDRGAGHTRVVSDEQFISQGRGFSVLKEENEGVSTKVEQPTDSHFIPLNQSQVSTWLHPLCYNEAQSMIQESK